MSWFSLGRSEGFPAQYGPNATSVTVDLVEIGIIAGFAILFLTFLVAFVPTRTWKSVSEMKFLKSENNIVDSRLAKRRPCDEKVNYRE